MSVCSDFFKNFKIYLGKLFNYGFASKALPRWSTLYNFLLSLNYDLITVCSLRKSYSNAKNNKSKGDLPTITRAHGVISSHFHLLFSKTQVKACFLPEVISLLNTSQRHEFKLSNLKTNLCHTKGGKFVLILLSKPWLHSTFEMMT